jgi:murein DD-endopeptidase MepM/ murein hydrolase activator NlpD
MILPLKGVYWVGGNSRRDAITHAGMNRFCFDFMGSTEDGKVVKKNINGFGKNEDYIGFGVPIYSPITGVVIDVADDIKDLEPSNEYRLIDGNHVTIEDENGFKYVFVHNKYHSAKVKKGQKVKKGDVLALIGNTGMTTVPHLHFGVYSPDWIVSIPIIFTDFIQISNNDKKNIKEGIPLDKNIIIVE